MAAAREGDAKVRDFPLECRVVVDDVDEDRLMRSRDGERVSSEATASENPTAKIKRFQVEAESRKMEFARLLEEHAQVIRRLKQMEEKEATPRVMTNSVAASATKA